MKKILTLFVAVSLITVSASAQDLKQRRNEISIFGAGGLSSLQYNLSEGEHKVGFGGQAGLGYSFFFSPYWSLGTGVEFARYRATATLPDNLISGISIQDYREQQRASYINIPLMVQYQTGGNHKLFAALGGKIGFPVKATIETDTYSANKLFMYTARETNLDKLNLNLMASAEMGIKWKTSDKNSFYTGIFADFGFHNIQSTNEKTFINSAASGVQAPIIESQVAGQPFTDKITPLAAGVKIRLSFGAGKTAMQTWLFRGKPQATERAVVEKTLQEQAVKNDRDDEPAKTDAATEAKAEIPVAVITEPEPEAVAEVIIEKPTETDKQAEAASRKAIIDIIQQPVEQYGLSVTTLNAAQKQQLDEKIDLLKQNADIEIVIYGHTCDIGSDAANERVGLRRAENAKAYMISKGIEERRILGTASKRDTDPVVPNTNEENRRKNRRVTILVR